MRIPLMSAAHRLLPLSLTPDDPRLWAQLFTRQRLRKGWSYVRLSVEAGLSERVTVHACTTGRCHGTTALKLVHALSIVLTLPPPPRVLSAHEAQHGR